MTTRTYQEMDALRTATINLHKAKPGLRGKVDAMCCECIYDPGSGGGTWREQVEACTSPECPLYEVRPRSKPHD